MPKNIIDLSRSWPLLDLVSHGRRGPGSDRCLTPQDIAVIARTVRRTPEVMVKVLNRGGGDLRAVGRHLSYISRKGELELVTDEGERLSGEGSSTAVLENWDLDLEETRSRITPDPTVGRPAPKLVQKLILSMPPGTPVDKVLAAAKALAREEFGLRHRYVMALHTDEPHPHVHLVVKAMGENGERLNIRRETLRGWRQQFAQQLRAQGVPANATPRQVRGPAGHRRRTASTGPCCAVNLATTRSGLEPSSANCATGAYSPKQARRLYRRHGTRWSADGRESLKSSTAKASQP